MATVADPCVVAQYFLRISKASHRDLATALRATRQEYKAHHGLPSQWSGGLPILKATKTHIQAISPRQNPNSIYPPRSSRTESPPTQKSTMASWLNNTKAQFAATAIVSGAIVAGSILGYQHVRRQEKLEDLKSSIPPLGKEHQADKVRCAFSVEGEVDMELKWKGKLTGEVKLTDFGAAATDSREVKLSKEDERAVQLAARAQRGEYDDGMIEGIF